MLNAFHLSSKFETGLMCSQNESREVSDVYSPFKPSLLINHAKEYRKTIFRFLTIRNSYFSCFEFPMWCKGINTIHYSQHYDMLELSPWMPETILTVVIDWVLSKRNKPSTDFKIYGCKCTILWSHWQNLEESQGQLGLGKDDANLNFKIDSSV